MRLYHNPRCSKSRQAVQSLRELNIDFEEHRYLDLGILETDITILANTPGIIRSNELNEDEVGKSPIDLLRENPKLLQRPVLIHNGNAVIGRPVELILQYLQEN